MIDEAREALYCLKRVAGSHAITQDQLSRAALRLEQALALHDSQRQQAEAGSIDNPWRISLENCISGDNYLRASEYRELIAELDDLYRMRAAAPTPVEQAEPAEIKRALRIAERLVEASALSCSTRRLPFDASVACSEGAKLLRHFAAALAAPVPQPAAAEPACDPTQTLCGRCDNDMQRCPMSAQPAAGGVPDGYALVPVEPTEEMLRAGCASEKPALFKASLRRAADGAETQEMVERIIQQHRKSYAAMLAAAPQAGGEKS